MYADVSYAFFQIKILINLTPIISNDTEGIDEVTNVTNVTRELIHACME